jgi:hypothetical protein
VEEYEQMYEYNGKELTKAQETLIYWINERRLVRTCKEAGLPKPWSKDPVMQTVYFCNVDREDDKVTRWIREHYTHDCPAEANMAMARLVNRITSLEALGWPWEYFDVEQFKAVAESRKPFWGSAYVVTTHGQPMSKVEYACGVLQAVFTAPPIVSHTPTLEQAHSAIQALEGFGSFMAAQVVADLKNTSGHPLEFADDWCLWSAHGPGSLRGLSWFWGDKITPGTYRAKIKAAWEMVMDHVEPMCMQNFQNCFCEYDKYMRVSNKTGRSKRSYPGAHVA